MREQLLGLLEPVVDGLGYELVELEFNPSAKRALLRAFIDRRDGEPVTLDDCEAVSRALESVLDAGDAIPRAYELEVSSPIEGRRRFRGRLLAVREATLDVEVDGKTWAIPLGVVRKARLVA
jgi:ribosome maturation factor RimP